jgi:GNAT superfamily N-acetyltransferase
MITTKRTNSDDRDFIELVKYLDAELPERWSDEHPFYAQFNKIDKIKYVVVAYEYDKAVGCGAIKEYNPDTVEVKRMYTAPSNRGKGIATTILMELEKWATELSSEMHIRNREKTIRSRCPLQKERVQTYSQLRAIRRH